MRWLIAVLLTVFATGADAETLSDLKAQLATCLRDKIAAAPALAGGKLEARAGLVLYQCKSELDQIDQVDLDRTETRPAVSPSSAEVIDSVFESRNRDRVLEPAR